MLREYIAIDLEMTGLKPTRDKILEIGAVHMLDGSVVEEYQALVNPKREIPKKVVELTGITNEMAETGKELQEAMVEFLEFGKGLPLLGHNIYYDYGFLKQNAINCGLPFETKAIDTLKLSRKLLPDLEKKTLEYLCKYFGFFSEQEHRALQDAQATAQLYERLFRDFSEVHPELFEEKPVPYKVKKQGPITPSQKKYLKELVNYHKIELSVSPDSLTKSEASRLTDRILLQYGRIPTKNK